MWATSLTPVGVGPYFSAPIPKSLTHFPINVAINSRLTRQPAASSGGNNPEDEERKEISGTDVLWALQRAAAQKKKAQRKNKRLASSSSDSDASKREKDGIHYSNVRPLEIKTEWSLKLDELEKRLHELEQTT